MPATAGNLNDLYSLDPANTTSLVWINLTLPGIPARNGHGFTAADGKLYVFGGMGDGEPDRSRSDSFPPCCAANRGRPENIRLPLIARSDF